jgi:hypothetical protein
VGYDRGPMTEQIIEKTKKKLTKQINKRNMILEPNEKHSV